MESKFNAHVSERIKSDEEEQETTASDEKSDETSEKSEKDSEHELFDEDEINAIYEKFWEDIWKFVYHDDHEYI